MTRVVCVSDTHNRLNQIRVPDGDVLVHAGDATMRGTVRELAAFNERLGELPHKHKVVVSGNHDWLWEVDNGVARAIVTNATYLQDELLEVAGVRIWGSPWTPMSPNWAFNAERGHQIRRFWDLIPDGLDLLVTHGPPRNYGDRLAGTPGKRVGCADLLFATQRAKPRYHVFGHVHEGYGVYPGPDGATTYVNASTCDVNDRPVNPPVVLEV